MTNVTIDNSASDELGKVVLWQYDKAYNLLRILDYLGNWYTCGVEQFWNAYPRNVIGIDTANAFGLSVWGTFLGMPRPTYRVDVEGGETRHETVSDRLYGSILKSRFFLMKSTGSVTDIVYYLGVLFGCQHYSGLSGVFVEDLGEMAMSYSRNTNSPVMFRSGAGYSSGSVFAVVSVYRVAPGKTIAPGTSWAVAEKSAEEDADAVCEPYSAGSSYLEGAVVEHGGLVYRCTEDVEESTSWDDDADSFSQIVCFSEESSYEEGDEFCRIVPYIVREDIEPGVGRQEALEKASEMEFPTTDERTPLNTTFWDDLTEEQRALFESANSSTEEFLGDKLLENARTLLPYPAGIRFNTPFDEVVFGFAGQERQELSSTNPKVGSFCEPVATSVLGFAYEDFQQGKTYSRGTMLRNQSPGAATPFVSVSRHIGKSRAIATEKTDGRIVSVPSFSAVTRYGEGTYVTSGGALYMLKREIGPTQGMDADIANGDIAGPLLGNSSSGDRKTVYEKFGSPGGFSYTPAKITLSADGESIVFTPSASEPGSKPPQEVSFSQTGLDYSTGATFAKDSVLGFEGNVYLCLNNIGGQVALQDPSMAEEIPVADIPQYAQNAGYSAGDIVKSVVAGIESSTTSFYVCSSNIGLSRTLEEELADVSVTPIAPYGDTTFISQYLPSKWLGY